MNTVRRQLLCGGLMALIGSRRVQAEVDKIDFWTWRGAAGEKINRIRLSHAAQAHASSARLFFSQPAPAAGRSPLRYATVVSSTAIAGPGIGMVPSPGAAVEHFRVGQLLPGAAEWDVAADDNVSGNKLAICAFGGAVRSLKLYAGERAAKEPLTDFTAPEDFRDPRFSRGGDAAQAITSVVDEKRIAVLLATGNTYGPPRFAVTGDSIDSALILSSAARRKWLLFKQFTIAPKRRRFPGVLQAVPLTDGYEPAGPAIFPLGEHRMVYEFDADAYQDEIVIVATSGPGFGLARGAMEHLSWVEHAPPKDRGPLEQPAIARSAEAIHLAFVESAGAAVAVASIPATLGK